MIMGLLCLFFNWVKVWWKMLVILVVRMIGFEDFVNGFIVLLELKFGLICVSWCW